MGEIADMMLDGFLDEQTGELIDGESPGYPRTMERGCYNSIPHKRNTQQNKKKHVRTQDVKVGAEYLYKGERVTVLERIRGKETIRRNMQSGILDTGAIRQQKTFKLSNGEIVKADKLYLQNV